MLIDNSPKKYKPDSQSISLIAHSPILAAFATLNVFRAIAVCQLELLHQTELKQQQSIANIESPH